MTRAPSNRWYRLRSQLGTILTHTILAALALACVLPMLLTIAASFSEEEDIASYGYSLVPRRFTTVAYELLLRQPEQIMRAYGVTIFVTAVGTLISLLMMSLLAYVLSRPDFPLRSHLSFYVFFTMLFSGGLVPWYIWLTQGLHLKDEIWALILPYLVIPWYLMLLRTYFAGLPPEIFDAARIDGAGEWRVLFQIVFPLSTAPLATVGLFMILEYWNDWWLALLFVQRNEQIRPLQSMLQTILTNARAIQASPTKIGLPRMPLLSVRMAMSVLAAGPAALVFLAVQRYFVRGITVGGLK